MHLISARVFDKFPGGIYSHTHQATYILVCAVPTDRIYELFSPFIDCRLLVGGREEPRKALCFHDLITPESTFGIGSTNITTLVQVDKTANVMKDFKKYGSNILGLSEMRWTGFRESRTSTGKYILYSGSQEDYQREVGLALKKKAMVLLRWNPVSDRIMSADSILYV